MPAEICFPVPPNGWKCIPLHLDMRHLLFEDPNPPDPPIDRDILTLQTLATIQSLAERIGDAGAELRDMASNRMQMMARSMGPSVEIRQTDARASSNAA